MLIWQYQCFVESCDKKFWRADLRKNHAVQDHDFPKNFGYSFNKSVARKKRTKAKKKRRKKWKRDNDAMCEDQNLSSSKDDCMDIDKAHKSCSQIASFGKPWR